MEVKEGISRIEKTTDGFCDGKKTKISNWKAVIDDIKGCKGDPDILAQNLMNIGIRKLENPDPGSPQWDLESCSYNKHPWQAHHLVPEKQLPKHAVCVWLTDSPKVKDKKYELSSDTDYDTNHGFNGKFMPFASSTMQWKKCKGNPIMQSKVCNRMMELTNKQLHQGPHSKCDYGEDLEAETKGYKQMVDQLLKIIHQRIYTHVEGCDVCKEKQSGSKIKVQPLQSAVDHMYHVSYILDMLIESRRIWVSKRAYRYSLKFEKDKLKTKA